jgi:electron transfer flavoprotein alpha subunit
VSVLAYIEDPADELSQQALALAQTLGSDVTALTVAGDGYAPAAWGATLAGAIRSRSPAAVIAPGTDRGNELLAHVAAELDLPMAANCTSVTTGDPAIVTRIRWGGSLLEEAQVHGSPLLVTSAPHAVAPARVTDVETIAVDQAALEAPTTVKLKDRKQADTGGVSLADADVVVSGGRGLGSAEAFSIIEELADLLGGAVGCSRAVTSAGWRPHTDQVGQTGTKISPEIYIACGISGATQHMAGCKGAKKLLAINEDGEASIFASADYAVIGDLHEILPAISAEVRKARGS